MVLSLDRLRLDNDAVMVSGEMLRLDVFGGYEVMVVRVVGVADRWSDRLVDGDWVGWGIVLLMAGCRHLVVPHLHWKSCKASLP
jgi:hypothetical protein